MEYMDNSHLLLSSDNAFDGSDPNDALAGRPGWYPSAEEPIVLIVDTFVSEENPARFFSLEVDVVDIIELTFTLKTFEGVTVDDITVSIM